MRWAVQIALNQPPPWWAERVAIPAVFLLLGAVIGFFTTRISNWLERRKAKRVFLQAIRLELLGIEEQLKASLTEVAGGIDRLQRKIPSPPQLVGTLRNTVFTSQLGTLADLSDPLLIEIVRLYSDVPVLLQIIEAVNRQAPGLHKDDGSAQQAQRISSILSTVLVLQEQLVVFMKRTRSLIEKLEKARPPAVTSSASQGG